MSAKILLLGGEEKPFVFIRNALSKLDCIFEFLALPEIRKNPVNTAGVDLLIVDTLPFSENDFSELCFLNERDDVAGIAKLALVNAAPPRLRYRLIQIGMDDYLTVPFDRLDVEVRVKNLLKMVAVNATVPVTPASDEIPPEDHFTSPAAVAPQWQTQKIIRNGNHDSAVKPSDDIEIRAVEVLKRMRQLHAEMIHGVFKIDKSRFFDQSLAALKEFCGSDAALMFEVLEDDKLSLKYCYPEALNDHEWILSFDNMPPLQKAVKMGEPTILNSSTPDHPFAQHIRSRLNIAIKSFLVHPVQVQKKTRWVLCLFNSGQQQFTDYHYLLAQNFTHIVVHAYYLSHLRTEVRGQMDRMDDEVWQFYFEFLDQVINQLSFGIIIISDDRRIKYLNENAAMLLGVDARSVMYQTLDQYLDKTAIDQMLDSLGMPAVAEERPELRLEINPGMSVLVGYSVEKFSDKVNREEGYIISLKDITHAKGIQEEMRRVDRLASLGVMASGIAHEIRNPLAGIKAMAQTFEEELAPGDPKNEYVQRIIRLVNRLDELLRTLFSYAKPSKPNRRFCDLEILLQEVTSLMIRNIEEHDIRFEQHLEADLPKAFVDSGQIQQVLVNLLLNSIEAISDGGAIDIRLRLYKSDKNDPAFQRIPLLALQKSDTYIEIKISDSGCGIPADNLKHIFNPFFTTKTFGTGLGLSIVYQIVKENNGIIHYESEIDRGTDCYLYLPVNPSKP